MESVWSGEGDKEVAFHPETPHSEPENQGHRGQGSQKRFCGLRKWTFIALTLAILIIVAALAIGLGVGLWARNSPDNTSPAQSSNIGTSDYSIGGALNPAYYSKKSAFNGTGIALASESFDGGTHGDLVMYFQHWSGQIRWQELNDQGQWVGGDITTVVASDAKNSTPLSAVAYALNRTSTVSRSTDRFRAFKNTDDT